MSEFDESDTPPPGDAERKRLREKHAEGPGPAEERAKAVQVRELGERFAKLERRVEELEEWRQQVIEHFKWEGP